MTLPSMPSASSREDAGTDPYKNYLNDALTKKWDGSTFPNLASSNIKELSAQQNRAIAEGFQSLGNLVEKERKAAAAAQPKELFWCLGDDSSTTPWYDNSGRREHRYIEWLDKAEKLKPTDVKAAFCLYYLSSNLPNSQKHCPEAFLRLGELYQSGDIGHVDYLAAIPCYQKAARWLSDAWFPLGCCHLNGQDIRWNQKALNCYNRAQYEGDKDAGYIHALLQDKSDEKTYAKNLVLQKPDSYDRVLAQFRNSKLAPILTAAAGLYLKDDMSSTYRESFLSSKPDFKLYEKAAELGDPDAQYELSKYYWYGGGDKGKSTLLLERAANGGHDMAKVNLGYRSLFGNGAVRDLGRADHFLEEGYKSGGWVPEYSMLKTIAEEFAKDQDYQDTATKWVGICEKEFDSIVATKTLALRYRHGKGAVVDLEKSFSLFQKAARTGDPRALYEIGWCYYYGWGTSIDKKKAYANLMLAVKGGWEAACYLAGRCLCENWDNPGWEGLRKDANLGEGLLLKAAKRGSAPAQNYLAKLYWYGKGNVASDLDKSFYWVHQAAMRNHLHSIYSVGLMHWSQYRKDNSHSRQFPCREDDELAYQLMNYAAERDPKIKADMRKLLGLSDGKGSCRKGVGRWYFDYDAGPGADPS